MSIRRMIEDAILTQMTSILGKSGKSNQKYLNVIYFWQEVSALADVGLKEAWREAQESGMVPSDNDMRALGEGDHMVVDTQHFSVLAKVSKPRANFDRDLFIAHLVKKYKLQKARLEALAETCKVPSKRALSKSVVEAAK